MNDAEKEDRQQQEEKPTMNEILRGNRTQAEKRKESFRDRLFSKSEPEKKENDGR